MMKNILCIYSLIEKKGITDRYVQYMLENMKNECSKVITVIYNNIDEKEKKVISSYSTDVISVDNEKKLCEMYFEALKTVNANLYDVIIFCSSNLFGPVFSIGNLMNILLGKGDFYGISANVNALKMGNSRYIEKEKVSINFFALKGNVINNLINNDKFKQWISLSDKEFSYEMTDYLVREGYEYYPIYSYDKEKYNYKSKVELGCCFVEFDELIKDYIEVMSESRGESAKRVLKYLKTCTEYNTDMIYEHLLKISNISDIYNIFHLNYILPSDDSKRIEEVLGDEKAVVIIHMYYMDMIEYFYDYIINIPKSIDIIITTTDKNKGEILENVFRTVLKERLRIIVSEGNGRELAALLVEVRKYIKNYDYICFTHDKKSLHTGNALVSKGFQQLIVENVLNNGCYIANVIESLKKDKRLGLLVPPPPLHGIYFASLGRRWTLCFEPVKQLLEQLNIEVDVDDSKNPLATGSAFWCKKEALLPIFEKEWKHEDFPDEPMANDGTISHAIERSFPFIAQSQGFYTGMVMTVENASLEFTNREYVLEKIHIAMHKIIPTFGHNVKSYIEKINHLDGIIGIRDIGVKQAVKKYVRKVNTKVRGKLNIRSIEDRRKLSVIEQSELFDKQWYLNYYTDLKNQKINPAEHYLVYGWKEGRNPSEEFETNEYFKANPDVKAAGICPLYHFETAGKFEGRQYKVNKEDEKMSIVPTEKEIEAYNKHIRNVIKKQKEVASKYPVQNNKIVFKTFQSDYTCNPKYICEEIIKRKLPYDLVWITKNDKQYIKNYPNEVRIVEEGSFQAKEEVFSAKVLIDNGVHLFNFKGIKKQEQKYICTWHGSLGFKKLAGNKLISKRSANSAKLYNDTNDYIISNSTFEDDVFRNSYWQTTEFIKCGHPRNDILINNNSEYNAKIKEKVYNRLGIPQEMNVILYAPTFREKLLNDQDGKSIKKDIEELDFTKLIAALRHKFGGKWSIIIRSHFVDAQKSINEFPDYCYNGTTYPDIQELMIAADAALTDYSSWILDYMFTRKPAFLYTPDYDDYDTQRGFCYPLSEAPFSMARDSDELTSKIQEFNQVEYNKRVDEFLVSKGCREDGNGSKKVVDFIEKIISGK